MATRESKIVYSEAGAQQVRGRVISLTEALETQRRKQDELVRLLPKSAQGMGVVGSVAQSAAAKVTSLTNSVGPLGAGLGALTREITPATHGLVAWASAAEKASLVNRLMNATLLAGVTGAAAAGATLIAYADDILRASDTYSTLTARIRTFSDGHIAAAQTERELYEAGKDARVGVGDLTTLYTRLTPAVRDYGRAQQDALTITKLTSKALAIQGVDVREQAAATVQFSQSIASGVMRGDELRSLLESSPQLLRYIAQNLEINGKVGVAFSSLRKLGEEGMLTTDRVIDALLRAQPQIERDFINAPKTAAQGWVVLKDEIVRTIGSLDKTVGGQQAVVAWLGQMSEKAEAFRQKMLSDPRAFDGVKQAADFVGDAIGSIGTLGEVAVKNFDTIVSFGQAIIALKLGSVMASWFSQAATASRAAIGNLVEFQQAARFQAGAAQAPVLAQAAATARSVSIAADTRATDLQAAAELKAAQAANLRTAAYEAQLGVTRQKVALEQVSTVSAEQHAAVARAQAAATSLKVQADRAETASKAAAAKATDAATIAAERAVVAKTAEAAVTGRVTGAQLLQLTTARALSGAYALLGGGLGIATLAIGGLIWALIESNRRWREHYDTLRNSVEVTDRLRAATDAMAAATWAEIPGIMAKTKALREQAEAQEKVIAGDLTKKRETLAGYKSDLENPMADPESKQTTLFMIARLEAEIGELEKIVGGGRLRAAGRDMGVYREQIFAAVAQKRDAQAQLDRGTNAAGRPLTAEARSELTKTVNERQAYLQAQVDKLSADKAVVDRRLELADVKRPRGQATDSATKEGLSALSGALGQMLNAASEGAQPARPATPPPPAGAKPKNIAVPGGVSAAYTDLLRAGFLQLEGGRGFSAENGKVSRDGQNVTARSEDEAAALTRYVKIVESLNNATDAQIKKEAEKLGVSARSKDDLKLAAGAILEQELATSKASRAQERWADVKAEMEGTTRAEIKAESDLQQLIRDGGVSALDPMIARYRAWIAAKEKAAKLSDQIQAAQPLVQQGFENALARSVTPTDARGVVDEVAAVKRIEEAKAAVLLDSQRAVDEEIARLKKAGQLTDLDEARKRVDLIAGYTVAVEIQTQEQILAIRRDRLSQNVQAAEEQARQSADAIVGALKDATFGGEIGDLGKRLINDLLSAAYDEILGNPMRLLIKAAIHDLFAPGAGGGGLFSNIVNAGLGLFGKANLGRTVATTIAKNPLLFADGRVPGYADGKGPWMDDFVFRGRGGPRGDDNLVRVSDREAIINAKSTQMYASVLKQINDGTYDPLAALKNLQGFSGYADGRSLSVASAPRIAPVNVVQRQGDVILNNNTGQPITARRSTDRDGNTHLDLRPMADQFARSAGRSGALSEGLRQSPRPIKRG